MSSIADAVPQLPHPEVALGVMVPSVIGDGDTDLDLFIYDTTGQLVAKDEDPPASKGGGSDICRCQWTPRVEQEYTIKILNYGKVYNIAQAGCN